MRRDDDVRVAGEQRVVGDRLAREDVERRPADLARVERRLQCGVVDERAARDVEDPHAVLHLRERLGVEPALGLGRLRQVHGDEVGLGVHVIARLRLVDAHLAVALGADERIERDHAHAEPLGAVRHELADAAEAEDPERLLVQLDAGELRALPLARGERHVRLRHVAREREQQRHRVLGGGHDVGLRGVGDDDPALGRRRHVDVVDADPGAPDRTEVRPPVDEVLGELRRRADEDAVVLADALGELLVAPVDAEVDVEVLAQERDAGVADLLLDEHPQASAVRLRGRAGVGRAERAHAPTRSTT